MSTIGQIKDLVRDHFGRTSFSTTQLKFALDMGRREIEKSGNYWWMRDDIEFNLINNTAEYEIGDGSHIDEANFKDIIALNWKESSDVQWEPVNVGDYTKEELDIMYQTDEEGHPEVALIDNDTLVVYPPQVDDTYDMKMYYWKWTSNPTDNNDEDVITKNFPEALLYAGIALGYQQVLKDPQQATYYLALLGGTPFGRGGEIVKIRRENFKRGWKDNMSLVPSTGPYQRVRAKRSLDNTQIYPGKGGWR